MATKSVQKNAILNVIRVLMSVLFPLITFPYATRVLGAENMGKVQFGASFITYFSLIAALGITTYGVRDGAILRKDKEKFNKFANEIFTINIISTLISYAIMLIILLFPTRIADYGNLILIQSLVIIFTTLGVDWIYGAMEDYLYITIKSVMVQAISLVLLFLFVKSEGDYYIYALITVVASAGMNLFNFFHVRKYCKLRLTRHLNLKRHIRPLMVLFASAVAVNIYINSDVFMLGLMSSDAEVGIYSVSVKVYSVVRAIINAIITVTIPRLSIYRARLLKDKYYRLSSKVLNICVLLLAPAMIGLAMMSSEIVKIIAGDGYAPAYSSLMILAVALFFAVLSNYFANAVLVVNGKEKFALRATMAAAITNVALNLIFIPLWGHNGAAITTLASEILVTTMCMAKGWKDFGKEGFSKNLWQSLLGCVIVVGACLFARSLNMGTIATLAVAGSLGAVSYGMCLLLLKNDNVIELYRRMRKKIR